MAGHNKWSKVKHRKAVVDKRRSKAWSMCSRAIIVAARTGGPDPEFNVSLRQAIDEARYYNMPNDNIERAIKKGAGGGAGEDYEFVRYEGYGPGGVAVVIDALTDNRTRTAGDVRLLFTKHSGKLGATGCVSHQFEQKGRLTVIGGGDEDKVFEIAVGAGADDVRKGDAPGHFDVLCVPTDFARVRDGLLKAGLKLGESAIEMFPTVMVTVAGEQAEELIDLVDGLEENDDVKKVYSNADIPESELARLAE